MGSAEVEQTKAYSRVGCTKPPARTWQRKFEDEGKKIAMFSMTMTDIMTIMPLIVKVLGLHIKATAKGQASVYDPFKKWMDNCYRGVPLGVLGSGSIGRSYRGYFQHFQIFPRVYEQKPVLANQFSAFVSRPGGKRYATILSSPNADVLKGIDKNGIGSWDWNLKDKNCAYHGLFPRSWTTYEGEPDPEIKITCRQISPFIPHNYKESSFPVAVFTFTVENSASTPADVTLLFTWANSVGGTSELTGNHTNSRMKARDGVNGVLLRHRTAGGHPPVTFGIASQETGDVRVTCCPSFAMGPSSSGGGEQLTAKEMWAEVKNRGSFSDAAGAAPRGSSRPGSSIGAAVAATTTVPAGGTREVSFALSWSCPEVKFPAGRTYHRRYTKFLGLDRDAAAEQLVHDALLEHMKWESLIDEWQRPVLEDKTLPDWYPVALFNELYYLNAGGTIWTDGMPPRKTGLASSRSSSGTSTMEPFSLNGFSLQADGESCTTAVDGMLRAMATAEERLKDSPEACFGTALLDDGEENVGQFLYLEGMEYHMWNTYDVHFYASFALLSLFPAIELSLQRDFARAVLHQDPRSMHTLDGATVPRKVLGAVPHDFGLADPWFELNAYMLHDPIVEEDKARSALGTVLDYNVMRVQGGAVGAVNGMRPDGAVDTSSTQSKEVWPGVTYGVAAAMIHEGMPEAAFQTAKGAHDAGWGRDGYGYAFQTPEAWTAEGGGGYRSLHYMRPLCIWAMQWALSPPELHKNLSALPGSVSAAASPAEVALAREKFEKVANMVRLPEEEQDKGYLGALYQILRQMILPAS
ncbi:non-lysosomal glucosylceramidase-like [Lolium rigidum]|uniref:non-lysosomal glucosylceramidase-like n=1 Tax=Lolium rigidum TaxID=89674 RepID=UPI001F5CAA9A|nr:non-lysosomal glucosylceramidase-like [Lolium rigidum]